jgi:uncharacterized membrane protein HdeD (DUF308 family)
MMMARSEYERLWHTLVWRGGLMVALGVAAVWWPEPVLVAALLAVGAIASLLGIYEVTVGAALPRGSTGRPVVVAHGLVTLAFGLMTVGAPALSLSLALAITIGWLLLYAGVTIGAAMISKFSRRLRATLWVWGSLNVVFAAVVALFPEATIFALLVFGAAYAALNGAWQVAVGLWLRHQVRSWGAPQPHVIAVAVP